MRYSFLKRNVFTILITLEFHNLSLVLSDIKMFKNKKENCLRFAIAADPLSDLTLRP